MRDLFVRPLAMAFAFAIGLGAGGIGYGQEETKPGDGAGGLPAKPEPIPPATLGPTLKTVPVPRSASLRGLVVVDPTPLPRDEIARRNSVVPGVEAEQLPEDRQKFWVLDFAFKPVRMMNVETPKGRRQIYYLYYRVVNHTGQPRLFVPQFTLVTDDGKAFPDMAIPRAVDEIERRERPKTIRLIEAREDPVTPVLGAVDIIGELPLSDPKKQGVDDAVYGVAVWELNDAIARADSFRIYIRGLSDGSFQDKAEDGTPIYRYKTLRLDFASPGDERNRNEGEIRLLDPPYTWEYPEPNSHLPRVKAPEIKGS